MIAFFSVPSAEAKEIPPVKAIFLTQSPAVADISISNIYAEQPHTLTITIVPPLYTPPAPKHTVKSKLTVKSTDTRSHEELMELAGIGEQDWADTDYIITRESGWRVDATNGRTWGLPQSLPGNKMASAGADWKTNPVTQLVWFKGYCLGSYGGIHQARVFWERHHWY